MRSFSLRVISSLEYIATRFFTLLAVEADGDAYVRRRLAGGEVGFPTDSLGEDGRDLTVDFVFADVKGAVDAFLDDVVLNIGPDAEEVAQSGTIDGAGVVDEAGDVVELAMGDGK